MELTALLMLSVQLNKVVAPSKISLFFFLKACG